MLSIVGNLFRQAVQEAMRLRIAEALHIASHDPSFAAEHLHCAAEGPMKHISP